MPTEIRCPSCERRLKVPENLLGKMVRCPGCQQTFTASAEEEAPPAAVQQRPTAPARRPAEPPPSNIQEERPARRQRDVPPEDDFEETEREEELDEDRPRRRRRGNGAAASMVSGPAIGLMVVGGLDIFFAVLGMLFRLLGIGLIAAQAGAPGGPGAGGGNAGLEIATQMMGGILGLILGLVLGGLILFGGLKMKNLQSYGLALTACILALIPCHTCCFLGVPFGIWGIVMLNNPEVKEAFS